MKQIDRSNKPDRDPVDGRSLAKRRGFLKSAGAATALTTLGATGTRVVHGQTDGLLPSGTDPFTLGVASGDPLPTAVVIWTRLALEPLASDGGMPDQEIPVTWRVASDEDVSNIVRTGTTTASPQYAHSVHVDVRELEPNTEYYYQFEVESVRSAVGRAKTAPTPESDIQELDFAFVSCQNYPAGYYTAHRHLADEELDVAFHLGDYIYEGDGQGSLGRGHQPPHTLESLSDYRIRHAQYKSDADLQAVHAAFPWVVTWDDHEVANNYADEISQNDDPPEEFLERRANAYQAYWEHQPLRLSRMPDGPDMPLYRQFVFGTLAEFDVLDTRQYRSDQVATSEEANDPERTILGDEQERWLVEELTGSTTRWNVLAQQVPLAATDNNADPDETNFGGGDKWDGYRADRRTLLDVMSRTADLNPVVVTGDVHDNRVYDLKADFSDPNSETVGTEYVGTSISSSGDGSGTTTFSDHENTPWRKFFNDNRGYVRCTLTADEWRTDYRVVPTVSEPTAPINTLATFTTEAGDPGAKQVTPRVELEAPITYQQNPLGGSATPFEMATTVTNPGGEGAAANEVEAVDVTLTGVPDGWSASAMTPTQFEAISDGESVTVRWDVTPRSVIGDVTLGVEITYEIGDESYEYVANQTLSPARIAYWRFENDNADSSNNDHRFSLVGDARYDSEVAIEGDYSVRLAESGYVHIDGNGSGFMHDGFSERTVSMWVKPDSTTGIQNLFNEGGQGTGLSARINDGTIEAGVINSDSDITAISTPFERTEWTHVAVVFDAGALRLYVNGDEVAANEDVGYESLGGHADGAQLGATRDDSVWGPTDAPLVGNIDATGIYSVALSADQVAVLSGQNQYYQVDFVAGDVEEQLGENEGDYYGQQNRLIQYVHGAGEVVTERDTWINTLESGIRECVTADPIEVDDGSATVTFSIADGCERTLSLATYTLPNGEFRFDTASEQELVDSVTETVNAGEYTLTVDTPADADESG